MPRTDNYLRSVGVEQITPRTVPFDPGYDPASFESHLEQSSHLMAMIKLSMACWIIAKEEATRRKIAAAKRHKVPIVTGGGPFEIAVAQGVLSGYFDLCSDIGVTRVECGDGFTDMNLPAGEVVSMAQQRGLEVQFELGKKHAGAFSDNVVQALIEQGRRWLDAGAKQLVVESRESAHDVGLFDRTGTFNPGFADQFAAAFGLNTVLFEAPTKASQFALLDHFGPDVHLCNIRLEEVLRVEIYRRGLHSDSFRRQNLRPPRVGAVTTAS
jgi:phosphosulfolactate synthase